MGKADDFSASDVSRLVEIPGDCPQARIIVDLVSRLEPPKNQKWAKREPTADGGFLAESSASASPW
eukprot:5861636-Pleurochrysis_carterae.AAC.2